MGNYQGKTQLIFRAIADPTRREILSYLSEGDMSVGDIVELFDMSRPAIAKHLRILEEGALIEVVQRGRERINHLRPEGLEEVKNWVSRYDRFWDARFADLKQAVEEAYDSVNTD